MLVSQSESHTAANINTPEWSHSVFCIPIYRHCKAAGQTYQSDHSWYTVDITMPTAELQNQISILHSNDGPLYVGFARLEPFNVFGK